MEAAVMSPSVRRVALHESVWLRSRNWDLSFLILSAGLVPIPLILYHGLGVGQTAVGLLVAGAIGGPHLYSTFTYTFFEPNFRARHRRFLLGSLALPVMVTILAFADLQILLTIFYTWASIHVLHQISYINDSYAAKRPVVRPLREKIVDYGVVFTCLYPLATPQILDHRFQLGGQQIYVPHWADHGIVASLQIVAISATFATFFCLWVAKNLRDWRLGRLNVPSVLLIGMTIFVGFTLPLAPNIDVAFQGFNCWHSFQYLALIWFLNSMRKERGEIDNHFIAEMNGPDRPWKFYAVNVGLTLIAGTLVLAIHFAGAVSLQKAYYIVILSTLLQHYYIDHMQFTKLGDIVGRGEHMIVPPAGGATNPSYAS